jgi:hypothetical protein
MKTAVLYLRVSSVGQVRTDYDPEGLSIPAQRQACLRKAEQMGVEVIAEYVEPGRSATTIAKRPVFQQMMARLKQDRAADYVIVYNLSRLNRNRLDDAFALADLRAMGVTLVSVQPPPDEPQPPQTPRADQVRLLTSGRACPTRAATARPIASASLTLVSASTQPSSSSRSVRPVHLARAWT